MNKRPIEEARDPDLRLSHQALKRAAKRAQEIAIQTGTALIVIRNGAIDRMSPTDLSEAQSMQESAAPQRYEP